LVVSTPSLILPLPEGGGGEKGNLPPPRGRGRKLSDSFFLPGEGDLIVSLFPSREKGGNPIVSPPFPLGRGEIKRGDGE